MKETDGVEINIAGYDVIISACDVERVLSHKWRLGSKVTDKYGPYFVYTIFGSGRRIVRLHRFIVDCPPGMEVDHINRNPLDNRRENLRICSCAENSRNQGKQRNNTSGFKGVSKFHGRWRAFIAVNGKNIYLGSFKTPEEAYAAYCAASKKYHGEFGRIA